MKLKRTTGYILIIVAITLIAIASTYARYTSEVTGTATATAAAWSFKANSNTTTFTTIDLASTISYTNVAAGVIAPGTQGSFPIVLDGTGSQVDIKAIIEIELSATCPAGLKLYSDAGCTTEFVDLTDATATLVPVISGAGTPAENATRTVTVYWKWNYQQGVNDAAKAANDAADTTFAGGAITANVKVTGYQAAPIPTPPTP